MTGNFESRTRATRWHFQWKCTSVREWTSWQRSTSLQTFQLKVIVLSTRSLIFVSVPKQHISHHLWMVTRWYAKGLHTSTEIDYAIDHYGTPYTDINALSSHMCHVIYSPRYRFASPLHSFGVLSSNEVQEFRFHPSVSIWLFIIAPIFCACARLSFFTFSSFLYYVSFHFHWLISSIQNAFSGYFS